MAKRNLITVKEAAEILGLDERSVRERLINGQLKGEKRNIGLREKWFVSAASVDAAANKLKPFEPDTLEEPTTIESEYVDAVTTETPEASPDEADDGWVDVNRDRVQALASEFLKPLADKIETQAEIIADQRRTIADQERQIRLLPDLQKQAEERAKQLELEHVEKEALKKQVAALNEEKARLEIELAASKQGFWRRLFAKK